jgi:hypothetical protein
VNHSVRLAAYLALLLALTTLTARQPASKDPPTRAEDVKLPADAILLLYDKASDALRSLPKFVLLSPERYNTLVSEVDRLNKQLQARQGSVVNAWRVSGRVKGNVVELKATFFFTVDRDKTTVALNCSRADPTSVTVDGKVVPLWSGSDGLVIEVEKGERPDRTAVIEMLMPVRGIAGSAARPVSPADPLLGFELDLPLTPVTTVDMEIPSGIKTLEVNDQPLNATLSLSGNKLSGPLGRVSRLKLAWKAPHAQTAPQPLLISRGHIKVRLQDGQVITEAELALQDQGQAARDWLLQVPEKAQVRLANDADKERLRGDIQGGDATGGRITIPLANPGADPLQVVISHRRPRGSGPIHVGPFAVVGAATQSGIVEVFAEANHRIGCSLFQPGRTGFTVTKRGVNDRRRPEEASVSADASAVFQYWSQGTERIESPEPWFKLDVASIQGLLDTQVIHTLTLGGAGPADWRLGTELKITPVRAEVDRMEIDWPAPWQVDPDHLPREKRYVPSFKEDLANRHLQLGLDPDGLKKFEVLLDALASDNDVRKGMIPPVADCPHSSAVLGLPRPRGPHDHGDHRISIKVPPDTHDLRVPQPANPGLELERQEAHLLVYRAERFPSKVAVAWKAFRPEIRVQSVVDVTLTPKETRMNHEMTVQFEEKDRKLPAEMMLRVPADVLRVSEAGKPLEEVPPGDEPAGLRRASPDERLFRCKIVPRAGSATLSLEYAIPAGNERGKENSDSLRRRVALLTAAAATQEQTRLRFWADPGSRLQPIQSKWKEEELEIVKDRDRLPSLVLSRQGPLPPLTLQVELPPAGAGAPPVVVERALLQVRISEEGFQYHRSRFLVRQVNGKALTLAFPAPVAAIDLRVTIDGKEIKDVRPVENASGEEESADNRRTHLVEVPLPGNLVGKSMALEVTYQVTTGQGGVVGALKSALQPVALPGLMTGLPVRWQIDLPPGSVPVPLEGHASWRWGRRGWLLAPRPAVNNGDLERWFWGDGDPRAAVAEEDGRLVPSLVLWGTSLTGMALYHVPEQAWLLGCSLLVLVIGLAICHAAFSDRGRGRLFWLLLALLGLVVAGAGLIWPGLLTAVIYGGQPGLAVLLLVLAVQWLLHERYRRSIIFLPGFRRVRPGSSLMRKGRTEVGALPGSARGEEGRPANTAQNNRSSSGPRPRGEPSTVDAPPPAPG